MDILIAENDPNTISNLKTILEKLGHNIITVSSNGEEAIKIVRDLNPDLILIDINLKGKMSGVEAAKEIKSLYNIPIIFLTIFIKNCLIKSLQLPEDAIVLSKPVNEEHLKYCIKRAFSGNR